MEGMSESTGYERNEPKAVAKDEREETRECAAYIDEIREMRQEKERLKREIRRLDIRIHERIRWCTHNYVRKTEMCQYGEKYWQCSVCGDRVIRFDSNRFDFSCGSE